MSLSRAMRCVAPAVRAATIASVRPVSATSVRALHIARMLKATTPAAAAAKAEHKQPAAAAPAQQSGDKDNHSATEQGEQSEGDKKVVSVPASSFSDVVQKYGGWYPFLGLAGVIAVSKEVIILNEELLLVSNFAFMVATLYFGLGDQVLTYAEEQRAELHKKMDDISDLQIEALQMQLQAHEANIEQVAVLQKLKEEHNTLSKELNRVRALKLRHAARDAVVKRLGEVKSREASERASFRETVGAKATQYVRKQFAAAPANVKQQLVDFALDVVEGKRKQLDAKADPVKKLYADYFNNKLYEQDMDKKQ